VPLAVVAVVFSTGSYSLLRATQEPKEVMHRYARDQHMLMRPCRHRCVATPFQLALCRPMRLGRAPSRSHTGFADVEKMR